MSTILKALRRLEEEREQGQEKPLRESVTSPAPPRRGRGPWLVAGAALLGGIAIGVAALVLLRPGSDEGAAPAAKAPVDVAEASPPAAAAPGKPTPRRAALTPEQRQARAEERRARVAARLERGATLRGRREAAKPAPAASLPPAALASEVEVVERPEPSRAPAEIAETEVPASPEPAAPRPPETVVAAAPTPAAPPPPAPLAKAAPAPVGEASPTPRPASPPVAEPAPAPKPPPRAPAASEPRAPRRVVRAAVPSVQVIRTTWHPDPSRRVAVVEVGGGVGPRELREGDAIGTLVVEQISPTGVTFAHDGVSVTHRVGGR